MASGDTTLGPQAVGRASLFVDDSANSVGINTTTPAAAVFLEVADGTDPIVSLNNTGNGEVRLGCTATAGYIGTESNHPFNIEANSATALTVLANGNIGIGNSSPASLLDIRPGATGVQNAITMGYGRAANPTDAVHKIRWASDDLIIEADSADTIASNIQFRNDGNEVMRIDSSGNLNLTDSTDQRIRLNTSGAGGNDSVNIRGDGNALKYNCALGATGVHIFETGGTERMRILQTGGLTFNGDTAQANALDDYEEGTWTPTATNMGNISSSGRYTKIGRVVYYEGQVQRVSGSTIASTIMIGGLPFTVNNIASTVTGNYWLDEGGPTTNNGDIIGTTYTTSTNVFLVMPTRPGSAAPQRYVIGTSLTQNRSISFYGWYPVA